jgi:hypothetical protein
VMGAAPHPPSSTSEIEGAFARALPGVRFGQGTSSKVRDVVEAAQAALMLDDGSIVAAHVVALYDDDARGKGFIRFRPWGVAFSVQRPLVAVKAVAVIVAAPFEVVREVGAKQRKEWGR